MVSAEEIAKVYRDWPLQVKKAVDELLCNQPEQRAIYHWEHPHARTYVSGPICIMGDAAHATTPFQGSGCGMSFEDALILYTLLGRSKTPLPKRSWPYKYMTRFADPNPTYRGIESGHREYHDWGRGGDRVGFGEVKAGSAAEMGFYY
ncbi:hypothetical protein ACJ73_06689 [Blastomyces percursus]|uniref:FAD-binding domain-containing protein n=1 Tax=Blastomyces percursus TaxID=1658174 RepID=A0A1J9Q1I5_9EURO|nr:hypothetical protein ACJ73_06689 [Blastomyces percursus]